MLKRTSKKSGWKYVVENETGWAAINEKGAGDQGLGWLIPKCGENKRRRRRKRRVRFPSRQKKKNGNLFIFIWMKKKMSYLYLYLDSALL